ncbi:putative Uncharacterized membrane protein [Glarea lozoyensis 74030]|uniref:Putative Uncharacterized membrane protein n=1 Tax=Glarea lozoyensis (strain ATCC 74030 / MF5533) TaxID=1104152 RepID=H0EFJ2_GLAL7|nr:putative Uncharacterized membrane protein [Glarea lozoyensis 74030]
MHLTRQPKIRDPDQFPTTQLFLLAIVRLAEPIALTSIFPYAFPLVKRFHVGRACGGFLNGNIGVIQTMVGELVTKPEHEPRAYSIMPFVWSIGTILGPAIGGYFADPSASFPDTFSPEGLFGKFPYLLPNLLCSGLLGISIVAGYFLLFETHPDMQPRVSLPDSTYTSEETPLIATADAIKTPAVDLRADAYGTFEGSDDSTWRNNNTKVKPVRIFTKRVIAIIVALGIFTYHSMTYDHLLPIFLEDDKSEPLSSFATSVGGMDIFHMSGGLGISIQKVGVIMSINGIIALFVQAVIFPFAAQYFGIHRLFILVSILHPIAYIVMPFLVSLPESWVTLGIYACLTIRNLLSILAYPVLLILLKEATPSPSVLGKINGLAASAGAACRTVAPPVAGYLYTIGSRVGFTGIAWYGSAFVAIIGAIQCFSVKRAKTEVTEEDQWDAGDCNSRSSSSTASETSSLLRE